MSLANQLQQTSYKVHDQDRYKLVKYKIFNVPDGADVMC